VEARYRAESDMEMVKAAQEAINHRPNFAVDAIGDSDDEDGVGGDGEDVMDEVCHFRPSDLDEVEGRRYKIGDRR
jgi:hypothetical protein